MTDFFDDLERELRRAHRRDTERHARSRVFVRRRLPGLLATGRRTLVALAVVAALVAVVVTVARESDVERPATPPGKKLVATDVESGVRFSLDGRVLTVQLLPDRPQVLETVSGAEISATCGTNVAAPPGDPRRETTAFRIWPAGETSLSYRFPRDVSSWCRLDRQSVGIVASVSFPVAWSGARGPIAETANKWARHFAASPQTCTDYMSRTACEQAKECEPRLSIAACRAKARQWAAEHLGATVQKIAISGDRAAATISNQGRELGTIQLRRTATGEWLIDKLGEDGLTADLRRKLLGPVAEESAPAPLTTSTPAPKPTLMACLEATGLTASPQSAAEVMILKDKQHAVVVGVTDVYLAPTDAVKEVVDRGHAHRIGNYVVEFHDGKGDHAAIRQCIREAPNDAPPGASDGRSPLMICLEATGLTPKPLSTADHMIFMDDDGDLVVKIVLGEALANQTMAHPERAHRIGNYYFEFHGGKGDRTAIRTCIKENK